MGYQIKVSEHRVRGTWAGWKKNVGGRTWYFGTETPLADAQRQALSILSYWSELQTSGIASWTPDKIIEAERRAKGLPLAPLTSIPSQTPAAPQNVSGLSFYDACDQYAAKVKADTMLAASWRGDFACKVRWLKRTLSDMPLCQIGFSELSQIVQYISALPVSDHTGAPISPITAKNLIVAARSMFVWLDDVNLWEECRKFSKVWRVSRKALCRKAGRSMRLVNDVFSIDELAKLWRSSQSSRQQRLFLLLGLGCGFTQTDIGSLTKAMVRLDDAVIVRERHKTGVEGRWVIPSELVAALRHSIDFSRSDLAIVTREQNPVVAYSADGGVGRTDLVRQAWSKLLAKSGVRKLGFKHLRKTGATLIESIADLQTSQQYLSHVGQSIAERHYIHATTQKLDKALAKMWNQLRSAFDTKAKAA